MTFVANTIHKSTKIKIAFVRLVDSKRRALFHLTVNNQGLIPYLVVVNTLRSNIDINNIRYDFFNQESLLSALEYIDPALLEELQTPGKITEFFKAIKLEIVRHYTTEGNSIMPTQNEEIDAVVEELTEILSGKAPPTPVPAPAPSLTAKEHLRKALNILTVELEEYEDLKSRLEDILTSAQEEVEAMIYKFNNEQFDEIESEYYTDIREAFSISGELGDKSDLENIVETLNETLRYADSSEWGNKR